MGKKKKNGHNQKRLYASFFLTVHPPVRTRQHMLSPLPACGDKMSAMEEMCMFEPLTGTLGHTPILACSRHPQSTSLSTAWFSQRGDSSTFPFGKRHSSVDSIFCSNSFYFSTSHCNTILFKVDACSLQFSHSLNTSVSSTFTPRSLAPPCC